MPTFSEKVLELSSLPSPNSLRNHLLSASSSGLLYYAETIDIQPIDVAVDVQDPVDVVIDLLPPVEIVLESLTEELVIEIQDSQIEIQIELAEIEICQS